MFEVPSNIFLHFSATYLMCFHVRHSTQKGGWITQNSLKTELASDEADFAAFG